MNRILGLVVVLLLAMVCAAHAQTGCPTSSGTAVVVNPTTVQAELPEHTVMLLDGSPAVTGYTLGWYAEGASAPTSTAPIAKSAWTLVAGTGMCYETPLPSLGVPLGQKYYAAANAVRGTVVSPWSAASNPFGFESPTPRPVGVIRLRK